MNFAIDPDEWETFVEYHDYGNGMGSAQSSLRRRAPEEVARIKAERLAAYEADILAKADAIRARRAAEGTP